MLNEICFSRGWQIIQDVYDIGEEKEIYRSNFDPTKICLKLSEWEPIEKLGHLQVILSDKPYFGRELRYFNQSPWWYRYEFELPIENNGKPARLWFEGADYYCKVWLNEQLICEHEGYSTPVQL